MDRLAILDVLKRHEADLRHLGVCHAALFGSAARGTASPAADIDILVDIAPDHPMDVFGYAGLIAFIRGLFPQPVDVANRETLKSHVRPAVERDALYAF